MNCMCPLFRILPSHLTERSMGCDWHFVFMGYGDGWRERRRIFHQYFHPNAALQYRPIELKGARELLRRLLTNPDNFMRHLRQ